MKIAFIVLLLSVSLVTCMLPGCGPSQSTAGKDLISAIHAGDSVAAQQCLQNGTSANSVDNNGISALAWAIHYGNVSIVESLLVREANPNVGYPSRGLTPLMLTAVPLKGRQMQSSVADRVVIARMLLERGADVNATLGTSGEDGSGQTALHLAAASKNPELVRTLLAAGVDPRLKESHGWTALDVAKGSVYRPNDEVIAILEAPENK
jgi:uncharacterized protein